MKRTQQNFIHVAYQDPSKAFAWGSRIRLKPYFHTTPPTSTSFQACVVARYASVMHTAAQGWHFVPCLLLLHSRQNKSSSTPPTLTSFQACVVATLVASTMLPGQPHTLLSCMQQTSNWHLCPVSVAAKSLYNRPIKKSTQQNPRAT
jgi:hypothetical protein